MPSFDVSPAGGQGGSSPAFMTCPTGSRRISPWSAVKQSYSDWIDGGGEVRQSFVVWRDTSQNFACYGNGDPVALQGEQGETVLPHLGSWPKAAYPGPSGPIFTNPVSDLWIDRFFPVSTPFDSMLNLEFEPAVAPTNTTGDELRSYLSWPPMRRVLRHASQIERDLGFAYLVNWNEQHHIKRPYYHLSLNGLQVGGPKPFIGVQVGGYDINQNKDDEAGNNRQWNWSSSWSFHDSKGNWNAWDKGHHMSVPLAMLAFCGHSLGHVNLWNDAAAYWQNFRPGHDPANGNGFDQPRSGFWQCLLAMEGYAAGHEWADADMVKDWMGGLVNQNGGLGWRPSETMDWVARRILGVSNGGTYSTTEELVYFSSASGGSDDNVLVTVCPNCTTIGTEADTGVHGCERVPKTCFGTPGDYNNENWIDSNGTNWGDQVTGVDMWQSSMCLYGLALLVQFHEFIVSLWGPAKGPLAAATYASAKQFLLEMVQQVDDRAVSTDAGTSFYCGVRSRDDAVREPAGFPQAVATEMREDIDFRLPSKNKNDYMVRQVRGRTDEYVVAQNEHPAGAGFYALIAPAYAVIRGVAEPRVAQWLTDWLPDPGQNGSGGLDYSQHARYLDHVYRLMELDAGGIGGGSDVTVIPTTKALVVTRFAPVVTIFTGSVTVTPGTRNLDHVLYPPIIKTKIIIKPTTVLTLTRFAPQLKRKVIVPTESLTLTRFRPVLKRAVIPGTKALTLTEFAPQLKTKIIPPTRGMQITEFAPDILLSGNVIVTPGTRALVLSRNAPTIRKGVVPGTKALTITRFAPRLATSIRPATKALSLTPFAPDVSFETNTYVRPQTKALTIARFAPKLTTSIVVPTRTLTLTRFAPELRRVITVGTATLTVTRFAPVVDATKNVWVRPFTRALTLTTFAPSLGSAIVPGTRALTLTRFAPATRFGVVPGTKGLVLTTFVPELKRNTIVVPGTRALVMTRSAPLIGRQITVPTATLTLTPQPAYVGVGLVPPTRVLVLTIFAPTLTQKIIPPTRALVLTSYVPFVGHKADPGSATLILTTFAPALVVAPFVSTEQEVSSFVEHDVLAGAE